MIGDLAKRQQFESCQVEKPSIPDENWAIFFRMLAEDEAT
jgi:hypothetical protein